MSTRHGPPSGAGTGAKLPSTTGSTCAWALRSRHSTGLVTDGDIGSFDLAYVDADKKSYDLYYERALQLVRPGGIVAIDNVLWHGAVADPDDGSRQAVAMRALNRKIRADERVSSLLLPIGDGLTLARRR